MPELLYELTKCKGNKAPGLDRVLYEFYKNGPMTFLSKLLECYNLILDKSEVPEAFVKSIIFPIHKKGNVAQVENYRGLTFANASGKIFVGILYNRLLKWEKMHGVLTESQAGFRPGYSTIDNIFSLLNIIRLCQSYNRKKIYAFFIDFKSAFDMVDRRALYYKLYNIGVSAKFIKVIQSLYKNTEAFVWDGENLSQGFYTNSGVKQGCKASPLLFSLFINDLEDYIEPGINIDGLEIKMLLYADDIVLFADDPIKLQRMIQQLENYCKTWNLVVNLDKSKIMIFQRGGGVRKSTEKWFFDGREIEIVKEYTYLGIVLSPKLSLSEHFKKRLNLAKASINSTWRQFIRKKDVKFSDKLKVFNAVSRSVLCYGSQVWGYLEYEDVEKLQRFFIKKLLHLPQQTPNYVLLLETGLSHIYIYQVYKYETAVHI